MAKVVRFIFLPFTGLVLLPVMLWGQVTSYPAGAGGGGGSTTISAAASGEQVVATGTDTTHAQKGLVGGTGIITSADGTTITFSRDPAVLISRSVSTSNPVDGTDSCAEGDLWWNSTTDLMWVCQSNSNTWKRQPFVVATTAPAACSVGELFFDSDATAGSNLFGCTATDTWTALGGGGGGVSFVTGMNVGTPANSPTVNYVAPLGFGSSTGEANRTVAIPVTGTLTIHRVATHTAQGGSGTMVCTARTGAAGSLADSGVSFTISTSAAAGTIVTPTGGTVSVTQGEAFSWGCVNAGGATSATFTAHGVIE